MMKKVYILIATDVEDSSRSVYGVYATRELAEREIAAEKAEDTDGVNLYEYTIEEDFLIED
jgi:hypothetical protein